MLELSDDGWVQLGSDIDGEAAGDNAGSAVSLSADGARVAVGAPGNDGAGSSAGHVRVFAWSGSAWVKLGNNIEGEASYDMYGSAVSLSADGARVAVGASSNDGSSSNAGHVRVF